MKKFIIHCNTPVYSKWVVEAESGKEARNLFRLGHGDQIEDRKEGKEEILSVEEEETEDGV